MTPAKPPASAFAALAACDAALRELADRCCEPGRSPSMEALAATLGEARRTLGRIGDSDGSAGAALTQLEDARAQVRRLRVGCCAPDRLPYYSLILEELAQIHTTVGGIAPA